MSATRSSPFSKFVGQSGPRSTSLLVLICFQLTFSFSSAFEFDFSSRGPNVDYTPSLEGYQNDIDGYTWQFCGPEAQQFHLDFWGYICSESIGKYCIETYSRQEGHLWPSCTTAKQLLVPCTEEESTLRACSDELSCYSNTVRNEWDDIEATRLECLTVGAEMDSCTAEEEGICRSSIRECKKQQVNDETHFFCCSTGMEAGCRAATCEEEEASQQCSASPTQAYCTKITGEVECQCADYYGDGRAGAEFIGCIEDSWFLRLVLIVPSATAEANFLSASLLNWEADRLSMMGLLFEETPPGWVVRSMTHEVRHYDTESLEVTLRMPLDTRESGTAMIERFTASLPSSQPVFGTTLNETNVATEPKVYARGNEEATVLPTGLEVVDVYFRHDCEEEGNFDAGCWVVDIKFTTGKDGFNVLYLPNAETTDETASTDFDYSRIRPDTVWSKWNKAPADMYFPENFPCTTNGYTGGEGAMGDGKTPIKVSSCCIPEFNELLRPLEAFSSAFSPVSMGGLDLTKEFCDANDERPIFTPPRAYPVDGKFPMPRSALQGTFRGLENSKVDKLVVEDKFLRMYSATVFLDELELRRKAGMLKGTVGVQHIVDTFIGIAEFLPTDTQVLNTFMTQIGIHVEKTDFFSVSSYGDQEYSFLQYINIRLVEVQGEDLNATIIRNEQVYISGQSSRVAHYAQITFTVDSGYRVKEGTEVLPIDSIRAGHGAFTPSNDAGVDGPGAMYHACSEFTAPAEDNRVWDAATKSTFMSRFQAEGSTEQGCAPQASMCLNPPSMPDMFVAFNVPLGVDWIPTPSEALDVSVFVHAVVQVEKSSFTSSPSTSVPGEVLKTTLFVSVPVVPGGVNIFCDSVAARTDLKSVADAVIVVGSADSEEELERLTIIGGPGQKSIADSVLSPADSTEVNSSSIESGLVTLVVLGDPDYFNARPTDAGQRPQSTLFGINLEDVITIHIMEQHDGFGVVNGIPTRAKQVVDLVNMAGEANTLEASQKTIQGYKLNGAFRFEIDRRLNRAYLEPTDELLQICGWRAERPTSTNYMSTTCVIRRDISRQLPTLTPGVSYSFNASADDELENYWEFTTAMELPTEVEVDTGVFRDEVGGFMQTVLGESEYVRELGESYASVIARKYQLDGRSRRAWWINPGYDWVPSLTGGVRKFQLTQKLLLFALFNLDENAGISRRRLLSNVPPSSGAGMSTTSMVYNTNLLSNLASALDIPTNQVATWVIKMQLTYEQECLDPAMLEADMRDALVEYLRGSASQVKMVQIMGSHVVRTADEPCTAAQRRRLQLSPSLRAEYGEASAELDTIVAFNTEDPYLDEHKFLTMPGVIDIQPLFVPDNVVIQSAPADDAPAPAVSPASDSTTVILVTAFSLVSGTICTLLAMWAYRWRKKHQSEEAYEAQAGPSFAAEDVDPFKVEASLKDQLYQEVKGHNKKGSLCSDASKESLKF